MQHIQLSMYFVYINFLPPLSKYLEVVQCLGGKHHSCSLLKAKEQHHYFLQLGLGGQMNLDAVEEGDEVDEGREECREELQHDALRDLALGLGDCPVSITRIQRTGADSPSSDK